MLLLTSVLYLFLVVPWVVLWFVIMAFSGLLGYKTFFMLNSTEHEISTAHKAKIPTNKEVSCFKSRCYVYHANKC